MNLRIESYRGAAIAEHITPLAQMRIAVFHEYPYLYEGSVEYEAAYLKTYAECPRALAVLVWDGERCVGASTVLPLAETPLDVRQPFLDAGLDVSRIDYFGESVLLRAYRGQGLGVKFFELREAHAREEGLSICAFCSVVRPLDHPAKPADYVPNDAFWGKRGYRRADDLRSTFSWRDIGEEGESRKSMIFWLKQLEGER